MLDGISLTELKTIEGQNCIACLIYPIRCFINYKLTLIKQSCFYQRQCHLLKKEDISAVKCCKQNYFHYVFSCFLLFLRGKKTSGNHKLSQGVNIMVQAWLQPYPSFQKSKILLLEEGDDQPSCIIVFILFSALLFFSLVKNMIMFIFWIFCAHHPQLVGRDHSSNRAHSKGSNISQWRSKSSGTWRRGCHIYPALHQTQLTSYCFDLQANDRNILTLVIGILPFCIATKQPNY